VVVVDDEMRMQTWRWTELLQMRHMFNTGRRSYVGTQVLDEFISALLMCSYMCQPHCSSQTVWRAAFDWSVVTDFG